MSARAISSRCVLRNRNQNLRWTPAAAAGSARAAFEPLEGRLMMARISWVNAGTVADDSDGFNAAFGAAANVARQIVNVAITDWSFAVQDFKYADTSHDNEFKLFVSASNHSFGYGVTQFQKVDTQGKPYQAEIVLDDDANGVGGGWFLPEKWLGAGAYVSKSDFVGEYKTNNPFRRPIDMYTTILHEIGHALGIGMGGTLKINQFLTPAGGTLFNFQAGSTTAQFTSDGGGHVVGDDLMRQFQQERHRRQITPLDIAILRDAYGYTVIDSARLPKLGELPPYWTNYCTYYNLALPEGLGCVIQEVGVAPRLDPIADVTINEGGTITFDAIARDDNPGEVFVYSLGAGAPAGASIHPNTGTFTFTPADNAEFTITVIVGDNGCGCAPQSLTDSKTFKVTASNVAPTAGLAGQAVAIRGQNVPFTATASDPSSADASAGFSYLVDWGDGTGPQAIAATANNGVGQAINHVFANDGIYSVHLTATDKDGATSTATRQITIASSAVLPDPSDPSRDAFFLGGIAGDDAIRVTPRGITVNGTIIAIPAGVARLVVFGQDGDDVIDMNGSIELPVILDGGAGSDRLTGGRADDILLGGPGDDFLKGHLGRDLLIGGADADNLNGQEDDDILIGGSTAHDDDLTALSALMLEWTRMDLPAVQRMAHLQTGGTGALNGTTLLDAASLLDDAVEDLLVGGPGDNWLL